MPLVAMMYVSLRAVKRFQIVPLSFKDVTAFVQVVSL